MVVMEEWQWLALALGGITFAATVRSLFWVWVSLAALIVGSLVWYDAAIPLSFQLTLFGVITLGGFAVSQFFIKATPEGEEPVEPVERAIHPGRVIGRAFTLTEPIVNGFGQVEIEGKVWRVRGEDAQPGERIQIVSIDGVERDLLIAEKVE